MVEAESRKRTAEEKALSLELGAALASSVQLHLLPKSTIAVHALVLQDDGGALPAAVSCASLALAILRRYASIAYISASGTSHPSGSRSPSKPSLIALRSCSCVATRQKVSYCKRHVSQSARAGARSSPPERGAPLGRGEGDGFAVTAKITKDAEAAFDGRQDQRFR